MPLQPLTAGFAADAATGADLPRAIVSIMASTDDTGIAALRAWQAHLDAGRIGNIVRDSPDRLASEAQCREMDRIFGVGRGGVR